MKSQARPVGLRHYLFLVLIVITITVLILVVMGRHFLSRSGTIQLWVGQANGPENSQQISDWYTFSHIIHGFIFYGVFRLLGRGRWSLGLCLLLSVFVEASWEIVENTPAIIDHYRNATASVTYYGDSILNSVCDILFCIGGFFLAARLPVWTTVTLALLMEVGVGLMIRDNLTLNVLMFLWPIEWIKRWQMGA